MDGQEIRGLREELGVSREELARRLHVSPSTVERWESGLSTPSGETYARLQRLKRLKDFQREGRLISLGELLTGCEQDVGNGLPPWHEASDVVALGHLGMLVSPPKCGKTLTALRWAYRTCHQHGVPAYYVSTHWTPAQTLRHLEKGLEGEPEPDPELPFFFFQHDGKNVTGLLEELSRRIEESRHAHGEGCFVVIDWLQNLAYQGERFLQIEEKERHILRDLKTWSNQQRTYLLVIASQRGVQKFDPTSFPHFFELADSLTLGTMRQLKERLVEYRYQDLHTGGAESFSFRLPAAEELRADPTEEEADDRPPGRRTRSPGRRR